MSVRTYDLSSRALWALYTFIAPPVMLTIGALWIYAWLHGPRPPDAPGAWFPALWIGGLAWGWQRVLKIPYRIAVRDERTIEFVAVLGRTSMAPEEISSIRLKPFQSGILHLRYARGKLLLMNQFSDFHQFLSELRRCNPGVELVGC